MIMELDLSRHCIETELRRQYNRAVSALLKNRGADDSLEPIVELAGYCLAQLDFSTLRSAHRALAGGTQSRVQLMDRAGHLFISIDGRKIPLPKQASG